MFTSNAFLVVGAALGFIALGAQAQSDTSSSAAAIPTGGIDACLLSCVTSAASAAGCTSFSDLTCVCTSTTFQTAATSCLQAKCTAADVQAAIQLQQAECASVSGATTIALSTTASTASSTSTSTSTTVSTATATSSSPTASGTTSSTSTSTSISTATTPAASSGTSSTAAAATSSSSAASAAVVFHYAGLMNAAVVALVGMGVGVLVL